MLANEHEWRGKKLQWSCASVTGVSWDHSSMWRCGWGKFLPVYPTTLSISSNWFCIRVLTVQPNHWGPIQIRSQPAVCRKTRHGSDLTLIKMQCSAPCNDVLCRWFLSNTLLIGRIQSYSYCCLWKRKKHLPVSKTAQKLPSWIWRDGTKAKKKTIAFCHTTILLLKLLNKLLTSLLEFWLCLNAEIKASFSYT